ncbi:MAG: TonB-dependent receptor [Xanthomonadaceae bacterium]|nr:TonB-dependent receptor [Xanthomonadaceae bacterium]
MLLKRNLMALALISAGLCCTAVVNATPAAPAAPAAGTPQSAQDQASSQTPAGAKKSTDATRPSKAKKLGTVQVTGFISSIENSTAIKRNADSIVEAVSSEQIGKLPGISIADALGRLPGLAVQTVSGRPQVLSIHGLGPDFSTALVNGGQQVSTSNNRDVQFDQYPSSWFNAVVVHLSPQADLIGQGLAGTVDMQTIRPLDKNKPEAAVNARYVWDGKSQLVNGPGVHDNGYNVNGVWVNQFADHTLGVTLGVDLESNPTQIEHQAPWGYPTDANGNAVIGGAKNFGISDTMKRRGLLATVQWQPNEFYTGTIDMTYDNFKEVQQAKGMEFPLFWSSATLQPGGTVQNGLITSGTYTNVSPVIRNDYNSTSARVYNFNWDNKFKINENWSADLVGNYSRAKRRDVNLESYSGSGFNKSGPQDTLNFYEQSNHMLYVNNSVDYGSGAVLTDPQGWGGGNDVVQAGFINAPHTVDYLANLKLSVERDFMSGPFSSVEFGVAQSTRNKTYHIDQSFLTLGGGTISGGSAVTSAPFSGGTCSPLAWMGVGLQPCYNPFDLIANGTLVNVPTFGSSLSTPPNWRVHENVLTPYFQFNLDTSLGNVTLRGNFGLQMQRTLQRAVGERVAPGSAITGNAITLLPVTGSTSYKKYLPSANLIFGLTDNDDVRVSAARTLARPRMDQMNASLSVSGNITHLQSTDPNQAYFSASGGNPRLRPTMADNYNVSYEHYFSGESSGFACNSSDNKNSDLCRTGGGGYFAVSGYFISLHDYINPNAAFLQDFSSFLPFGLTPAQLAQLGTTQGIVSGPTNDGRGYVKGAQVTLNLPAALITPVLNGFGVILTGNRTKSALVYAGNSTPITVPGLSKWVANGTLYYQHNGFEARVSDSYRSNFLGEVSGISASRIEQTLQGGSTYDAQVSYTFDHGPLNGLTIIAQGSNLSNKTFVTFQNNDPRQALSWESYGRRYEIGISYKFM